MQQPDDKTQRAIEHFRNALDILGLDAESDEEIAKTPERFIHLLEELFYARDTQPPCVSIFPATSQDPVLATNLTFQSMCVHHLLPFYGTIDIAYIPNTHIIGFGSLGRIIQHWAARPQIQERLIVQIADQLEEDLKPSGLLVRLRARQLCMEMRGAKQKGVLLSCVGRGVLEAGPLRAEMMQQFNQHTYPLL